MNEHNLIGYEMIIMNPEYVYVIKKSKDIFFLLADMVLGFIVQNSLIFFQIP